LPENSENWHTPPLVSTDC